MVLGQRLSLLLASLTVLQVFCHEAHDTAAVVTSFPHAVSQYLDEASSLEMEREPLLELEKCGEGSKWSNIVANGFQFFWQASVQIKIPIVPGVTIGICSQQDNVMGPGRNKMSDQMIKVAVDFTIPFTNIGIMIGVEAHASLEQIQESADDDDIDFNEMTTILAWDTLKERMGQRRLAGLSDSKLKEMEKRSKMYETVKHVTAEDMNKFVHSRVKAAEMENSWQCLILMFHPTAPHDVCDNLCKDFLKEGATTAGECKQMYDDTMKEVFDEEEYANSPYSKWFDKMKENDDSWFDSSKAFPQLKLKLVQMLFGYQIWWKHRFWGVPSDGGLWGKNYMFTQPPDSPSKMSRGSVNSQSVLKIGDCTALNEVMTNYYSRAGDSGTFESTDKVGNARATKKEDLPKLLAMCLTLNYKPNEDQKLKCDEANFDCNHWDGDYHVSDPFYAVFPEVFKALNEFASIPEADRTNHQKLRKAFIKTMSTMISMQPTYALLIRTLQPKMKKCGGEKICIQEDLAQVSVASDVKEEGQDALGGMTKSVKQTLVPGESKDLYVHVVEEVNDASEEVSKTPYVCEWTVTENGKPLEDDCISKLTEKAGGGDVLFFRQLANMWPKTLMELYSSQDKESMENQIRNRKYKFKAKWTAQFSVHAHLREAAVCNDISVSKAASFQAKLGFSKTAVVTKKKGEMEPKVAWGAEFPIDVSTSLSIPGSDMALQAKITFAPYVAEISFQNVNNMLSTAMASAMQGKEAVKELARLITGEISMETIKDFLQKKMAGVYKDGDSPAKSLKEGANKASETMTTLFEKIAPSSDKKCDGSPDDAIPASLKTALESSDLQQVHTSLEKRSGGTCHGTLVAGTFGNLPCQMQKACCARWNFGCCTSDPLEACPLGPLCPGTKIKKPPKVCPVEEVKAEKPVEVGSKCPPSAKPELDKAPEPEPVKMETLAEMDIVPEVGMQFNRDGAFMLMGSSLVGGLTIGPKSGGMLPKARMRVQLGFRVRAKLKDIFCS